MHRNVSCWLAAANEARMSPSGLPSRRSANGPGIRTLTWAFTQVELLVVLAMLTLLVALLLPALAGARQQAKTVICLSNLRQWGAALGYYAQEERGYLPRRGNGVQPVSNISRPTDWFNALPVYLKSESYYRLALANRIPRPGRESIWLCPQAVDRSGFFYLAYAMNMALSTWEAIEPDRIDRVGPVTTLAFMTDGIGSYCSALPSVKDYTPIPRHRNQSNVVFLDGHVATFAAAYLGCRVGDPQRSDVRWRVPGSTWSEP
jgi:prepilin-type processing-associated H-X9-DG protein